MANYVDYGHLKLDYAHYIALCNLRSAYRLRIEQDRSDSYVPEVDWNYVHRRVMHDLEDFGLIYNYRPYGQLCPSWMLTPLGHGIMEAFDQDPGWIISVGNNKDVIIKLNPPEKPDRWEYE